VLNYGKLFITNVVPGRTAGGGPHRRKARLPRGRSATPEENEHFQVVPFGLHALRKAYINGLRFKDLRVPKEKPLKPNKGDGLTTAYHGLNLVRLSLCPGVAGSMRVMLANMLLRAEFRRTYGQPISKR